MTDTITVKIILIDDDEDEPNYEFSMNFKADCTIQLLRERLNTEFNFTDEYHNFQLFYKQTHVTEIDQNEDKIQKAKLVELFEAEEDDDSVFVFECQLKSACESNHSKVPKKIGLRNATYHHLKIIVQYDIKDFTRERHQSQRASIGLNVEVGSAGGGGNVEYETNVEGREYVRSHIKREYDFPCHIPREVTIDDRIDSQMVDITIIDKMETPVEVEHFNMAIGDRYITDEKNGRFSSQKLARFRTWKTVDGVDLNPHKNFKKGTKACDVCKF